MQDRQDETGFSMIEVVVALTLAGILLAVLAPLVIGTVVATGKMTTISSATQVAAAGNDAARAQLNAGGLTSCTSLVSGSPGLTTSTDQRGVTMRRAVTVTGACTAKSVATVVVRVTAEGDSGLFRDGTELASTRTRVYLP